MSTTQKEIARRVGLSTQSVARALHGHPSMAPETRRKVLETAQALGYNEHSNKGARALAARRLGRRVKYNVIAIVVSSDPQLHSVPYYSELLLGIETATAERGVDLFFFRHGRSPLPRLVTDTEVDGIVCVVSDDDLFGQLRSLDIPSVLLAAPTSRIPSLVPDDYRGTCLATQHLIDLGHRRIAYVGMEPLSTTGIDRFAGYLDTLEKNGIALDHGLIDVSLTLVNQDLGALAIEQILDDDPSFRKDGRASFTGVVCSHDLHGLGIAERLQERGFSVPRDFSVVGFDDTAHLYSFRPALTSIAFDRVAMGRRAVEILDSQSEDGASIANASREVFPVELKVHESTAPPRS